MLPQAIYDMLQFVFKYASHETSWMKIKNELIHNLNPYYRGYLSKQTKKNYKNNICELNELEKEIIEEWINMGGARLQLPQDTIELKG